jgi:hypothetical protein
VLVLSVPCVPACLPACLRVRACVWSVLDPAYDKSEAELRAFLQKLISEDKVELQAGSYSLKTTS